MRFGAHVHALLYCCYCFFTLLCMVLDFGSIEKPSIAYASHVLRPSHLLPAIQQPINQCRSFILIYRRRSFATPTLSCAPSRSFLTSPCLDVTGPPPASTLIGLHRASMFHGSPLLPTRSDVAYRTLVSKTYRLRARASLIQRRVLALFDQLNEG